MLTIAAHIKYRQQSITHSRSLFVVISADEFGKFKFILNHASHLPFAFTLSLSLSRDDNDDDDDVCQRF